MSHNWKNAMNLTDPQSIRKHFKFMDKKNDNCYNKKEIFIVLSRQASQL